MESFLGYLSESAELLTEESGKESDSKGKVRELNVGKFLNGSKLAGGKHMDSYRAQGKTPEEMAHVHNTVAFGAKYQSSPKFAENEFSAKQHANQIVKHLHDHGYGTVKRSVWTSQASDHASETGVEDANNSADNILTMDKSHTRGRNKLSKIALSIKTGHNKVNYSNPGLKAMEERSGANLSQFTKEHGDLVKNLLPAGTGSPYARYKALRNSPKKTDQFLAAQIKASSVALNKKVGAEFRAGLANKSSDELKQAIRDEVAPKTYLKHLVSREVTEENTGKLLGHKIYDLHGHVDDYLDHFHDVHVKPGTDNASATIQGTFQHPTDKNHPNNGKVMPMANWAISAGGVPTNASPRGAVFLSSEDNKKGPWHHTRRSEYTEYDANHKLVKTI